MGVVRLLIPKLGRFDYAVAGDIEFGWNHVLNDSGETFLEFVSTASCCMLSDPETVSFIGFLSPFTEPTQYSQEGKIILIKAQD